MKSAVIAGVIAMALGAASSATALAQQTKKEAAPGAVTSASKSAALPNTGSGSQIVGQQGVIGGEGGPGSSSAMPGNAGVVDSNAKDTEKARKN
jgi:hypothetical protein